MWSYYIASYLCGNETVQACCMNNDRRNWYDFELQNLTFEDMPNPIRKVIVGLGIASKVLRMIINGEYLSKACLTYCRRASD